MPAVLGVYNKCVSNRPDPLNKEGTRTLNNTCTGDYNCMGFAFKTFNWLHPHMDAGGFSFYKREIRRYENYKNNEYRFDEDDEYEYDEDEIEEWEEEHNSLCSLEELNDFKDALCEQISNYNSSLEEFSDDEEAVEIVFHRHNFKKEVSRAVSIENILSAFPNARLVNDFSELKEGEYGVVMAGCSFDFHFGVYIPTLNVYCHKMGGRYPETREDIDDIFGHRYDSERTFFAVKGDFEDEYLDIYGSEEYGEDYRIYDQYVILKVWRAAHRFLLLIYRKEFCYAY